MCSHQRGHYFLRPHLPTAGVGGRERKRDRQTETETERGKERERETDRQRQTKREREAGYCKVHQVLDLEIKALEVMSLRNQFAP